MSELPKIDFLYLNEQDMIKAGVMDMAGCVDTMEDMFKLLHSGDYRMAGANNVRFIRCTVDAGSDRLELARRAAGRRRSEVTRRMLRGDCPS